MPIDPRVAALCEEIGIQVITSTWYPGVRQTRAVGTLNRIYATRGADNFRWTLITIGETENNQGMIDEFLLWAVSDLVKDHMPLIEADTSKWLSTFDAAPIGEMQFILRGKKRQRDKLYGMIFERIVRAFGPRSIQPDLFEEKRGAA